MSDQNDENAGLLTVIDRALAYAVIASRSPEPRLLENLLRGQLALVSGVLCVVDEKGTPRVNTDGVPMTLSDIVMEAKADPEVSSILWPPSQTPRTPWQTMC